ncbi:MAG TPA: hypothetical protein VHX63_04600 [Acidobacteriaceae bacterium]|jgi:hypothetical protein|nr:hypothetical protein [Acidobacteriaceae bacterium]
MNLKRMPPSFRWITLAFALELAGNKVLEEYSWHIALEWLGAVALLTGIVLMIVERRASLADADTDARPANRKLLAIVPCICAALVLLTFLLLRHADAGDFLMGITLGIYLGISIFGLLGMKGKLRRC